MQSPRNATRRNRNIGTAKQGYGQNNRLSIPFQTHPRWIWFSENVKSYRSVARIINGQAVTFLVEETRAGCPHACTVDDIAHLLAFVPTADWQGIALIILRQPKRKEEILAGAWGRWLPYVQIDQFAGAAIVLESADFAKPLKWDKSLTLGQQQELGRLHQDGHTITSTKRHHLIALSLDSVRDKQLYRTLLHEIGHHVDFKRDANLFERKATAEKEAFAHRYADEWKAQLVDSKVIPFERMQSPESLHKDGLRIADFVANEQPV